MKFYEIERIKFLLGLPAKAGITQIEAKIAELRDCEAELEALESRGEAEAQAAPKISQWQALYKSEDWLGCWIGLGIIAAAILYFSLTGLSFKAPAFRWTTDGEFQSLSTSMAPVVAQIVTQAGAKEEKALEEQALAVQKAIAAKDRKAVGAAAKKMEDAANLDKALKDQDKALKAAIAVKNFDVVSAVAKKLEELAKADKSLQGAALALKDAATAKDLESAKATGQILAEMAKKSMDKDLKAKAGQVGKDLNAQAGRLLDKVLTPDNFRYSLYIALAYLFIGIIGMALMGEKVGFFITGFPFVFIISWVSLFLAGNYTIHDLGLEYVLFCLFLGLLVSNTVGVPKWMMPAVKTEFYIKSGLVILGARVLFGVIMKAGFLGMVQALAVVGVVWYSCWWLCKKLGIDDEFSAMLSSAVSICGVSAAIATSGAVKGDPKKLSYVTSIVLICAVPMMVLMPIISKAFGMPDAVAGAWLGGTLDTSGSVVAAGALISDLAMKVGVTVKMSQNVLIGVAAFILSVVWTLKGVKEGEEATLWEIWYRFPKFVLGFLASSLLFSFVLSEATIKGIGRPLQNLEVWWFALAFTSIGLETRFTDIAKLGGGRPALAFLVAQSFNVLWTLILAYLLFGGILFQAPKF